MNPPTQPFGTGIVLANRFALQREVGRGAMGHIWLAWDRHLDNAPVACKILEATLAGDRQSIADLKREVLLSRRLRHPNIVAVYTFHESDAGCFITMEYVEGENLAETLQRCARPFDPREVFPWLEQICDALDYAHSENILHRDIKPSNIIRGSDGRVRLADFGIAQTIQEVAARTHRQRTSGTILFMSPEQLQGKRVDHRSDQYSLVSTVYELLAGKPPFHTGDVVAQVQITQAPPIAGLSPALNDALAKGLAKRPSDRYPNCRAFYEAFARALDKAHPGAATLPPRGTPRHAVPIAGYHEDATTVLPNAAWRLPVHRLGQMLVEAGVISMAQLDEALRRQGAAGAKLGSILIAAGFADEAAIARGLAQQLQIPYVELAGVCPSEEVRQSITGHMARHRQCLPLDKDRGRLLLAMADPLDLASLSLVEEACGLLVDPCVARESDLQSAIERIYP